MVGERHQIHALALEEGIDLARIVIGFAAHMLEQGESAHPRVNGMEMQIAFHRLSR